MVPEMARAVNVAESSHRTLCTGGGDVATEIEPRVVIGQFRELTKLVGDDGRGVLQAI